MGKQDKKIKKAKAGKAKAEKIIEETVEKVTAKPSLTSKYDSERVEGCSDEDFALGVRCRELREEGEPWWAIARAMELPGAGDSATTGKKGASKARNVYKAAFGSFPRTFKTGVYKGKAERNEQVRELQRQKKAERRAIAKAGKSVISRVVASSGGCSPTSCLRAWRWKRASTPRPRSTSRAKVKTGSSSSVNSTGRLPSSTG
jgi:hypothetical protein